SRRRHRALPRVIAERSCAMRPPGNLVAACDRLADAFGRAAAWLILPVIAALFLQIPLREYAHFGNTTSNDIGQIPSCRAVHDRHSLRHALGRPRSGRRSAPALRGAQDEGVDHDGPGVPGERSQPRLLVVFAALTALQTAAMMACA